MYSSDIIVPVLSKVALEPFAKLTGESRWDNVLLDHLMAIEFLHRGDFHDINPVIVGESHEVVKITTHTHTRTHTHTHTQTRMFSKKS